MISVLKRIFALFISFFTMLASFFGVVKPGTPGYTELKAETILSEMTLNEKIGQLFMIAPESLQTEKNVSYTRTGWNSSMTDMLQKYPAGGIILFAANISDPAQILKYTSDMQSAGKYPMFIAVDEEGGRVARIGKNTNFDVPRYGSMSSVGETNDTSEAYKAGLDIGTYVKKYGFNVDFAPVADINTNPKNIVIGDRAFGSDPETVSDMVSSAITGFHDAGMITCMKHFPGHGDTTGDTHTGYVSVKKTWDELKSCELIPYLKSASETDMIMVAHITLPNVTSDGLPASLSKELLTDKLRGELGYDGIIITDSLAMGAITQHYTSEECALKAIKAGVDILLMPKDYVSAFNGILRAVQNGDISEERIDESVKRILKLKLTYGIIE